MSAHNAFETLNKEVEIEQGGKLFEYGTTVPGSVAGYATGALFFKTDGGNGTALYVNEGNATTAGFKAIIAAD